MASSVDLRLVVHAEVARPGVDLFLAGRVPGHLAAEGIGFFCQPSARSAHGGFQLWPARSCPRARRSSSTATKMSPSIWPASNGRQQNASWPWWFHRPASDTSANHDGSPFPDDCGPRDRAPSRRRRRADNCKSGQTSSLALLVPALPRGPIQILAIGSGGKLIRLVVEEALAHAEFIGTVLVLQPPQSTPSTNCSSCSTCCLSGRPYSFMAAASQEPEPPSSPKPAIQTRLSWVTCALASRS